ncbi:hypothetical protein ACWD4G_27520 [Streptomyces sp. NPDC002643]
MHSSKKARRLSGFALLALGSAAMVLTVGGSTGISVSPADRTVVAADDLTDVVVPGEKATWTWDDQE